MTIDFFVHPEYDSKAKWGGGEIKKEYPEYFSHIRKILSQSQFPVLIKEEGGDHFFKEAISSKNQFTSNTPSCGHVSRGDWERFTNLLKGKESEDMRVHGSYYGLCIDGFAVQLFAHINEGEHWFINSEKDDNVLEMVEKHRLKKDFFFSNIRHGITLYPNISIQPQYSELNKLPLPKVTSQFTDSQTVVYGNPS